MRIASFGLFGIGIIVAISGGAKMPAATGEFPTTWPLFASGIAAAIVGVVLWRLENRRHAGEDEESTAPDANPVVLLADLQKPMQLLVEESGKLDVASIEQRVDELLETYVLPFAEVRRGIIDRFGMSDGAEILVTVAYGERMLNRAWSAAGDGYPEEARNCLPDARDAFAQAHKLTSTG